ncbi:MAG: hypothetical protein C0467_03685 [Planctomycetaceae bacterium]|nr:hypothetical protein [Planctomycetaceae bacterium]
MRVLPTNLLVCVSLTLAGCSGGPDLSPVATRSYDSESMAKAAIQQFDKNTNGTLELAELDSCPGLKATFTHIDTNNDNKLTAEELKARFEGYRTAGAVGYTLRVTLDGIPLPDATATLTPESFMNGAISEVTGKTTADGTLSKYSVDGRELPGLPSGVYRVTVTKDGLGLPAKYNTQSTLGCEVSGGGRGGNSGYDVRLTKK